MPEITTQLQDHVRRVADLRRTLHARVVERQHLLHALREQHAPLFDEIEATERDLAEAETGLKALALAHFEMTGEKRPAAGVEIKQYERLDYREEEAVAWARATGMALKPESLDVKAFEKIAKATSLPFVATIVEPKATIASDLDKALGVVEAA